MKVNTLGMHNGVALREDTESDFYTAVGKIHQHTRVDHVEVETE